MNAIFTGRKRSGKTTLAFDMAMRNGSGVIIFDPKREWRGWPATTSNVGAVEGFIKDGHEVIVFHPEGDKREAFSPLVALVAEMHRIAMLNNWDKQGRKFVFLVDEAVNVSTSHWIDEHLLSLVAENRPEILDIYLTFQSPKDANNLLKSRIDNWFIFCTNLRSDSEYLNKEIGVPEADVAEIARLRPHEYAHFYFDGGEPSVEFVYDPEQWFRPLEFFELNQTEQEEFSMAKRNKSGFSELFEDFFDFLDDRDLEIVPRERDNRRERERDREPRERESRRERKEYKLYE